MRASAHHPWGGSRRVSDAFQLSPEAREQRASRWGGRKTYSNRGDVGKIGGDTGSVDDIVQGELVNVRASLQQKREGLFNTISPVLERKRKKKWRES